MTTRHLASLLTALLLISGTAFANTSRFVAAGTGGGRAVLEFDAAPLTTMTPTPFTLTLMDPAGTDIRQARVTCDLTMPAMPMPENRPEARWLAEENMYRGEAVFTMAGAWRATCEVFATSGLPQTFRFDIPDVRLK